MAKAGQHHSPSSSLHKHIYMWERRNWRCESTVFPIHRRRRRCRCSRAFHPIRTLEVRLIQQQELTDVIQIYIFMVERWRSLSWHIIFSTFHCMCCVCVDVDYARFSMHTLYAAVVHRDRSRTNESITMHSTLLVFDCLYESSMYSCVCCVCVSVIVIRRAGRAPSSIKNPAYQFQCNANNNWLWKPRRHTTPHHTTTLTERVWLHWKLSFALPICHFNFMSFFNLFFILFLRRRIVHSVRVN